MNNLILRVKSSDKKILVEVLSMLAKFKSNFRDKVRLIGYKIDNDSCCLRLYFSSLLLSDDVILFPFWFELDLAAEFVWGWLLAGKYEWEHHNMEPSYLTFDISNGDDDIEFCKIYRNYFELEK